MPSTNPTSSSTTRAKRSYASQDTCHWTPRPTLPRAQKMTSTMDRVCNDHEPVIITRNGEQPVVTVSLEDFKSLEETAYLLRSPANAKRLLAVSRTTCNRTWSRAKAGEVKLIFTEQAWEDNLYRQQTDQRMVKRINDLIRETGRGPFVGIGKPEPLKHALAGFWSPIGGDCRTCISLFRVHTEHQSPCVPGLRSLAFPLLLDAKTSSDQTFVEIFNKRSKAWQRSILVFRRTCGIDSIAHLKVVIKVRLWSS